MAYDDSEYTPWESDYPTSDSISPDYQTQDTQQQTYEAPNTYGYGQNDLGSWGPSQEADDSLYNYQSDYPAQGYNMPGQEAGQGNFLQQLFGGGQNPLPNANTGPAQSGGMTSILSQLFGGGSKLLGSLMEGKQNKQKQQALNKIASSPTLDPFGSQRPFYQQQAQQVVNDPYSAPIVRAQTDELLRQANIRNAAHGRTMYQGGPELVAAQAGIAQKYLDSMLHAGGSQIAPDGKTIAGLQSQASNAGINGYASPLASAIGYTGQSNSNNDQLINALKQLAANRMG